MIRWLLRRWRRPLERRPVFHYGRCAPTCQVEVGDLWLRGDTLLRWTGGRWVVL